MPSTTHRLAVVLLVLLSAGQLLAADLFVPAQYPTIALALAAAEPGDSVILAPGQYNEHDLDLTGGVTLTGRLDAPDIVVINAQAQGRVFRAESQTGTIRLQGLTITGGRADGANAYDGSGGGLFVSRSDVRLESCRVVNNVAMASGGGLRIAHGSAVLLNCEVSYNSAGKGGGGMDASYGATGNARHTVFAGNQAAWGGGVSSRATSSCALFTCQLTDNQAVGNPGLGGALAYDLDTQMALTFSVVADNEARHGGGIYVAGNTASTLSQLTIDRNEALVSGGGLYCKGSSPQIQRSIISFHDQDAVACRQEAHPTLSNCNLFGNLGGNWSGDLMDQRHTRDNMSADPLYCAIDDRHLQAGSPCAPRNDGLGLMGAKGVGCDIDMALDAPAASQPMAMQAHPNPFNPITEVAYSLPADGRVRLTMFDVRGRRLSVLVDAIQTAGDHRVRWDARDHGGRHLASGTYLAVLESGGQRLTSKLMLLR